MESILGSIENVIKNWEKHHPGPSTALKNAGAKTWFQKPSFELGDINRRKPTRRRRLNAKDDPWKPDKDKAPEKFSLKPPNLSDPGHTYQVYYCAHCKEKFGYIHIDVVDSKSKSVPLYDMLSELFDSLKLYVSSTTTTSMEWLSGTMEGDHYREDAPIERNMASSNQVSLVLDLDKHVVADSKVDQSISTPLSKLFTWTLLKWLRYFIPFFFLQNKDLFYLKRVSNQERGLIFVSNCDDLLDYVFLYLSIVSSTPEMKVPYVIVHQDIETCTLRSLLEKIGFIFLRNCEDISEVETIASLIKDSVSKGKNVIISSLNIELVRLFYDDICQNSLEAVIVPASVSSEIKNTTGSDIAIFKLIKNFLYHGFHSNMVQVNFGKPYSLKSFIKAAPSFDQTLPDDVISHFLYDCFSMSLFAPTDLVSFLLLTKHREGVEVNDLRHSVGLLIEIIKDNKRFTGFTGTIEDITDHAISCLLSQNLIELVTPDVQDDLTREQTMTSISTIRLPDDAYSSQQLLKFCQKLFHMLAPRAVVSCAILYCLGGNLSASRWHPDRTLLHHQIAEKAEKLVEYLDRFLYICPPCVSLTPFIEQQIQHFCEAGLLATIQDAYDDIRHQKLSKALMQSHTFADDWNEQSDDNDDEGQWGYQQTTSYKVLLTTDNIETLRFHQKVLEPMLQMLLNVPLIARESNPFTLEEVYNVLKERTDISLFEYKELSSMRMVEEVLQQMIDQGVVDLISEDEMQYEFTEEYNKKDSFLEYLHEISNFL